MFRLFPLALLAACVGDKPDDTSDDTSTSDDTGGITLHHEGEGPAGSVTFQNTCAPDDGPALEFDIGLAEASCGADWASSASLRIAIDGGWNNITTGTYTAWGVWYDPDGDGNWEEGATATLTIDRVQGDLVEGSYRVESGGDTIEGSFGALNCYGDVLCG